MTFAVAQIAHLQIAFRVSLLQRCKPPLHARQSAARDKLPWTSWPYWVIHDLHEQPAKGHAGWISKVAASGARAIAQFPHSQPGYVNEASTEARFVVALLVNDRIPRESGDALASGSDVNQDACSAGIHIPPFVATTFEAQQQQHFCQQRPYEPPGQPQTNHERRQARPGAAGECH